MSRSNGDIRKRQIDTLKIFNDHVMELVPNEEYSIGFNAAGRTFQLDVHLSANFPNEAPRVELSPLINHPWVQAGTGAIQAAPGLVNFTVHSDLGRVVDAIIREFQRTIKTPSNNSSTAEGSHSASSTTTQQSSSSSSSTTTPTVPPATDTISPPGTDDAALTKMFNANDITSQIDLSALSLDELQQLNADDVHLSDFVEELALMQRLNEQVDTLLDEVESISGDNLSKESRLSELQQAKLKFQSELCETGDEYERVQQRYQSESEQFAPTHIKELLQIAVSGADSECDEHVEAFLGRRLEAGTFLERYIPAKVLGTVRKAKEVRLTHQLNALERATF